MAVHFNSSRVAWDEEKTLRHSRIPLCRSNNRLHPRENCLSRYEQCSGFQKQGTICYSVNVQAVSDSKALITNIAARWPEATLDSRIFLQ